MERFLRTFSCHPSQWRDGHRRGTDMKTGTLRIPKVPGRFLPLRTSPGCWGRKWCTCCPCLRRLSLNQTVSSCQFNQIVEMTYQRSSLTEKTRLSWPMTISAGLLGSCSRSTYPRWWVSRPEIPIQHAWHEIKKSLYSTILNRSWVPSSSVNLYLLSPL